MKENAQTSKSGILPLSHRAPHEMYKVINPYYLLVIIIGERQSDISDFLSRKFLQISKGTIRIHKVCYMLL